MSGGGAAVARSGRPSNDRDGECICDYNPETTDGPQEDCPFHGRPYKYWVERGDRLQVERDRLRAGIEALVDEWRYKGEFGWVPWQLGYGPDIEGQVLDDVARRLRALLAPAETSRTEGRGA